MSHKHAALMMEFALDAASSATPWDRWECSHAKSQWFQLRASPTWNPSQEYRRKPRTIRIGNHDVPAPMTVPPDHGTTCYAIVCPALGRVDEIYWTGSGFEMSHLKAGMVHETYDGACSHLDALISLSGGK